MIRERYDPELFALPEAVGDGQHVLATYLVDLPVGSDVIQYMKKYRTLVLRDITYWELSSTGTTFLGSEWLIMLNPCLIYEKLGYNAREYFGR